MESLRVLIVKVSITDVPGFEPLPQLQREVVAIAAHNSTRELSEPVRRQDILRAILDEKPFNIIHFAGHLCEDGFVASNEIIPLDMIVMYIQTGKPELVFFNTCSSEKVAELIASRCESDCIFTISAIENDDAIDFSEMFYSVLGSSETHSYKEARDRVDPTGSRFRYLPGKNVIVRRGDEVVQRLDALERSIGGGRLGEIGIIQRHAILEARVADIEESVRNEIKPMLTIFRAEHATPQRDNKALLWAIFGASFIAAVGIASLLLYMVQR
jgi:hypothetical protein